MEIIFRAVGHESVDSGPTGFSVLDGMGGWEVGCKGEREKREGRVWGLGYVKAGGLGLDRRGEGGAGKRGYKTWVLN